MFLYSKNAAMSCISRSRIGGVELLINKADHRKISSRLHSKLYDKPPIVKQAFNKAAGHHCIGCSDYCVQIVWG